MPLDGDLAAGFVLPVEYCLTFGEHVLTVTLLSPAGVPVGASQSVRVVVGDDGLEDLVSLFFPRE